VNPEIIIGPPGTGKTTALLDLVEEELGRGVPSEQIAFVSFTRRAAIEARERAREKFGLEKENFPWFRTLHSLCFRALGMTSADVLEGKKLSEFSDWIGVKITTRGQDDDDARFYYGSEKGDRIMQMEHKARIRGVSLREQYDEDDDNLS